jgi:protein TonB
MIHYKEENFSASNPGVKTNALISELFDPTEKLIEIGLSADSLKSSEVEVIEEKPFAYVEQMPSFPDGTEAMYRYIYNTLNYPTAARANGISGQVIIQFIISAEGEIQEANVVRGIGSGCDEEALRVVNSMPTWNPGKHNGRKVPVRFTLPIKFVI